MKPPATRAYSSGEASCNKIGKRFKDHLQKSWCDPKGSRGQGFKDSSEMLKNYKELKVWQRSYQLCLEIYGITKRFPKEERYGLSSQIRRAAVSVPSNTAEGYGRKTTPGYIRFLYIAYGSNCELETQILLYEDRGGS